MPSAPTRPRPPWSARILRAEFRVSRNSHLVHHSPLAPPRCALGQCALPSPLASSPPALEGRKPLAGGEGAQHREPPVWRITPHAFSGGVLEGREKGPPAPGPRRGLAAGSTLLAPLQGAAGVDAFLVRRGSGGSRSSSLAPPPATFRRPSGAGGVLRAAPAGTVLITLRVMPSAPTRLRPPWSARILRAEFRVSRNSHLMPHPLPGSTPLRIGTMRPTFPPCIIPPALEGRKPVAGGEGAQHREPPVWRITPDAFNTI